MMSLFHLNHLFLKIQTSQNYKTNPYKSTTFAKIDKIYPIYIFFNALGELSFRKLYCLDHLNKEKNINFNSYSSFLTVTVSRQ